MRSNSELAIALCKLMGIVSELSHVQSALIRDSEALERRANPSVGKQNSDKTEKAIRELRDAFVTNKKENK